MKRDKRRLREVARIEVLEELQKALAEAPVHVGEAYVFGSLAAPFAFDARSDLDIAVRAMDPREYFSLKCYLEERMRREVDLVEMESCGFADSIRRRGLRWTGRHS